VELVPFAADPGAFTAALLQTYDGSLDCPELTGNRTPAEMVDGFRGNGRAGGAWWFTVTARTEPVGVVMWEPGTEAGVLEIAYVGLVPTARGRGLGGELVRASLGFAREKEFAALHLSVDVRNEPAVQLYLRHGFRSYDERDVYLCQLTPRTAD
jgi:ribosomal protein S18 acetylase RimI-like enzyme